MRDRKNAWMAASLLLIGGGASAEDPILTIRVGADQRSFTTTQLLALSTTRSINVPEDVSYEHKPRQYLATPMRILLEGLTIPPDHVLQARADDGFIGQLPTEQLLAGGTEGAEAWLAIEPLDMPWPKLPNKARSAGPFYLVWLRPEAGGIRSEQWPYQLARVEAVLAPLKRWPQLNVAEDLPAGDPARAGLSVFLTQCLTCHALNEGGASRMGPDLNLPMNPTEYFTDSGLRALIRNPAAVRDWDGRKMNPTTVTDGEIDQIIAYLRHMSGRKRKAAR
jgi:mono/diheme cytochrome c family protein